jgi:hypothetical protein
MKQKQLSESCVHLRVEKTVFELRSCLFSISSSNSLMPCLLISHLKVEFCCNQVMWSGGKYFLRGLRLNVDPDIEVLMVFLSCCRQMP